jgi:hypothetical protein
MAMPPKSACLSCNGAVIYIVLSTIHRLRSCRIPCISENIHRNLEFAFSKTGWLFGEIVKKSVYLYQWIKILFWTRLATLIRRRSQTLPPPQLQCQALGDWLLLCSGGTKACHILNITCKILFSLDC